MKADYRGSSLSPREAFAKSMDASIALLVKQRETELYKTDKKWAAHVDRGVDIYLGIRTTMLDDLENTFGDFNVRGLVEHFSKTMPTLKQWDTLMERLDGSPDTNAMEFEFTEEDLQMLHYSAMLHAILESLVEGLRLTLQDFALIIRIQSVEVK